MFSVKASRGLFPLVYKFVLTEDYKNNYNT